MSSNLKNEWSITDGTLPSGLILDTETGEIVGTATESGTFTITVKVENDCGNTSKEIQIKSSSNSVPGIGNWLPLYDTSEYTTPPVESTLTHDMWTAANSPAWGWGVPVILDEWNINGLSTSIETENGNIANYGIDKGVNFGTYNSYWRLISSVGGRMNQCAVRIPTSNTRSFNIKIDIPEDAAYYMAVGGDDLFTVYIDGKLTLDRSFPSGHPSMPQDANNRNFNATRLYKIWLERGIRTFSFTGVGGNDPNGIWCELYKYEHNGVWLGDAVSQGISTAIISVSNGELEVLDYRIFSLKYDVKDTWGGDSGPIEMDVCEPGWILDFIGGKPMCVQEGSITTTRIASIMFYVDDTNQPLDVNDILTSISGNPQACAINTNIINNSIGNNITYNSIIYTIKNTFVNSDISFEGILIKQV